MTPLIRQGEGPSAAYWRYHDQLIAERAAWEETMQDILTDEPIVIHGATAGGDEQKLRGIPAIARGVPGAIPGTRP